MNYTKEQVQSIYKMTQENNADFDEVIGKMVNRGATFEGIDMNQAKEYAKQYQTAPEQPTNQPLKFGSAERGLKIAEKVADFTGGKELAQAGAVALAKPFVSKKIDETQKMQDDVQNRLIERIKEKDARGEDTTALKSALKELGGEIAATGEGAAELLNPNDLTRSQVVGDALQLATTAGGSKVAGAVAGKAKAATGAVQGLIQGVKAGAPGGAIVGGATGVSQELQKDGEKSLGSVLEQGVKGAIGGAIAGSVLSGVAGAVSGGLKGRALKKDVFIEDLVSPKLTQDVKEQAIKEGRVTEAGLLTKSKIVASNRDKQLADAVKDVVSPKKTTLQNVDAIKTKVSDINNGVKTYIKDNKVPFNTSQLKKQLNSGKGELKLIFASDTQAEKTYNAVVKEFIKTVDKKDTAGLFQARQQFDKIPAIRKLLESQGLGENAKREIVLTARSKANEYVANLLPKGNQYREQLLRESKMIEVIGNIAEKNAASIGKTKLTQIVNEYPILKWVVGGAVGAAGVGVGGSILGSLD